MCFFHLSIVRLLFFQRLLRDYLRTRVFVLIVFITISFCVNTILCYNCCTCNRYSFSTDCCVLSLFSSFVYLSIISPLFVKCSSLMQRYSGMLIMQSFLLFCSYLDVLWVQVFGWVTGENMACVLFRFLFYLTVVRSKSVNFVFDCKLKVTSHTTHNIQLNIVDYNTFRLICLQRNEGISSPIASPNNSSNSNKFHLDRCQLIRNSRSKSLN